MTGLSSASRASTADHGKGVWGLLYYAASLLFSFETAFVLFLFAGIYKADPRFSGVPVDLTALMFLVSVLAGAAVLARDRSWHWRVAPSILAGFAFIAWACLSALWLPVDTRVELSKVLQVYHLEKLALMMIFVPWCLIAGALIIAPDRARIRRFLLIVVLFSTWISIETLWSLVESGFDSALHAFGTDMYGPARLWTGRVVGLAAVIAFYKGVFESSSREARLLWMALFIGFGFVVLLLGGRGPALAVACALAVSLAINWSVSLSRLDAERQQRSKLSLVWIGILIAGVLYAVLSDGPFRTIQRFEGTVVQQEEPTFDNSVQGRLDRYGTALELWLDAPIVGHGLGSWPIIADPYGHTAADYPHNLILEIMAETGTVGLLLFGVVVFFALRRVTLQRLAGDTLLVCVSMLIVNVAVNTMFTADVTGNRYLFTMLGLAAALPIRHSRGEELVRTTRRHARRHKGSRRGSLDRKKRRPDGAERDRHSPHVS